MTTIVSPTARLHGRVIPRPEVPRNIRVRMFELLTEHFCGVDGPTFEADLNEKNFVILLEDDLAVLRGFSTLLVYRSTAQPGTTVVYSGDTIVEREWWGSPALPLTWLRAVKRLTPVCDGADVVWLLLTSGFRTYRFLPVFFRTFHPRYDVSDERDRALLDLLAPERFGDRYDPSCGVVHLERPQVLVPELLDVPDGRARDPHVRFFLERNPGYVRGDELVCLTRIDDSNLTAAGRRIARSLSRPADA